MKVNSLFVSGFITYLRDLQHTYRGYNPVTKYHGHPSSNSCVGDLFLLFFWGGPVGENVSLSLKAVFRGDLQVTRELQKKTHS